MSRITKYIASEMAIAMAVKSRKKRDAKRDELQKATSELVKSVVPKEVFEFQKKFPEYIYQSSSMYIPSKYFKDGRSHHVLHDTMPSMTANNVYPDNGLKHLAKLKNQWDKLIEEYNDFLDELERALFDLRTFKKVAEAFPSAVQHFPNSDKKNMLVPNFDSIKARL